MSDPTPDAGSAQRYLISSAREVPSWHDPTSRGDGRLLDRKRGSGAKRNEEDQEAGDSCTETRGETMIRTENLRSAFTKDDVDEYLYKLLPERDAVVREIEDYAAEHRIPIIGPAVARLLSLLVRVSGAKRIFEMGSAIGYSTIWLARAAGPKGKIFYTDGDPEKVGRAQMYFRMAGVAKRIEVNIRMRCARRYRNCGAADCSLPTTPFGPAKRLGPQSRATNIPRASRNSTAW